MRSSVVGWLRRVGVWSVGQKVHLLVAPKVCAGIHQVVEAVGPRYLSLDLVLKHHYDYFPVYLDPRLITGSLKANAGVWNVNGIPVDGLDRFRRWRKLSGGWKSARRHIGRSFIGQFVADGDWDREVTPFEVNPSLVQLFVENAEPENTTEYQNLVGKVQRKDFRWTRGFRTVDEIDGYFAQTAKLFNDMRAGGYRTQVELGNDGSDEIRVCIDRNGRLSVFGGGTHRLSIALLLGIPTVPVLVKRVHTEWVADALQRFGRGTQTAIAAGIQELATRAYRSG